jgi:hypothetical protein
MTFTSKDRKANDAAVRIRTLVHNTNQSTSLLSRIAADYMDLLIYHGISTANSKAVFVLKQPISMSGDGKSKFIRDDFSNPEYSLVPLSRWWTKTI